jgi:hypothetical protein
MLVFTISGKHNPNKNYCFKFLQNVSDNPQAHSPIFNTSETKTTESNKATSLYNPSTRLTPGTTATHLSSGTGPEFYQPPRNAARNQ